MTPQPDFFESDCSFTHEGKTYTQNGAFILRSKKDGKLHALLYVKPETSEVTDWKGNLRIPAVFGSVWQSGFVDYHQRPQENQSVSFDYLGIKFSGVWYNRQWSQIVRARSVKSK